MLGTLAAMEIRTERGFPQRLGKVFDFSTVPTRPNGTFSTHFQEGTIHLKHVGFLSEEWGAPPLSGKKLTN
jgi:hypothetical protein